MFSHSCSSSVLLHPPLGWLQSKKVCFLLFTKVKKVYILFYSCWKWHFQRIKFWECI
jgi:hypothetical protein